jgi:transposase InsO family protein
MLSEAELSHWFERLAIPEQGRAAIRQVRSSDPARRVGGGRRNVSGRYPSRKMGVTIQFESHRVELAEIYEMEHDADVFEYYDQPPPIKLDYQAANGRHLGVIHTADYFMIRTGGAGWVECKTEEALVRLSERNPNRYRLEAGRWRCPPGEAYATPLGLSYSVRSSRDIDWVYQANVQFLEDYFGDTGSVPSAKAETVRSHVAAQPGIALEDLFGTVAGCCSRDDVYWLIAQDCLFVDMRAERFTEPGKVKVFPDAVTADRAAHAGFPNAPVDAAECVIAAGKAVTWDSRPWKILNVGQTMVSLLGEGEAVSELPVAAFEQLVKTGRILGAQLNEPALPNQDALKFISRSSEAELRRANDRCKWVRRFLQGDVSGNEKTPVPARTLRRWVSRYRKAELLFGSGFLGLLSGIARRGNATSKLPKATKSLMEEFIDRDYENLKQKSKRASWLALRLECETRGLIAPSYKTYSIAIRKRPRCEQTLKRRGHRAAYQQETFYWELDLKTPRHGDRPFEVGHADHTQLDIELVCSLTGRVLGRPWLTILTDAFSRRVLASYLTFDGPSYRSCMMVLRECVYRHGRLPQIAVVDGGREFDSTYFETLLARYSCTKKTRPPAKARFGSLVERMFGTTNTQFIHNLKGNTQITRCVRQVTKGIDPKGQAVWALGELQEHLSAYFYEVYDTMDHPALGQSPRDAFQAGLASTGDRPYRMIPYDREFMIYTLPTTARGTAKVSPGRGVKVQHLYYWCEGFQRPEVEKSRVEVRYDPFDAGIVYAFVENRWVECVGEYYHVFQGHSRKEVMLAAEELRKRRQSHSQCFSVSAKKLAEFLKATEIAEGVLAQRLRDLEVARAHSDVLGAASAVLYPSPNGSDSGDRLNAGDEDPGDSFAVPQIYEEF